ncbi:MAG: EutN/CcmL family microcompartment protein [Acidimicrobiia bacterium]
MHLARVVGRVVATEKAEGLEGVRFLLIQPLDKNREPKGGTVVAADAVSMAGEGELVYFVSSREAAEALPVRFVPVDHAITGIVDEVHLGAGT